jgi:hypothetical protein
LERTLISWNLPNWITVVLMAAVGYAILGAVAQLIKRRAAGEGQAGG